MQIAHSDGGAVILSTSPYFADGTPNHAGERLQPDRRRVAASIPYVSIDDLYTVLDPGGAYSSVVDGSSPAARTACTSPQAGVDNLIEPALNQIIANVAGAVYASNA